MRRSSPQLRDGLVAIAAQCILPKPVRRAPLWMLLLWRTGRRGWRRLLEGPPQRLLLLDLLLQLLLMAQLLVVVVLSLERLILSSRQPT